MKGDANATDSPLLERVAALVKPHGLIAMGGVHLKHADTPQTLVLIGTGPTFWDSFTQSTEFCDGGSDPVDRWSLRVLPLISDAAQATAIAYPFGGPPFEPFIAWAKASKEAFDSPVGMLVHSEAGMMISYRGALLFDGLHDRPSVHPTNPCDSCPDRPCETACPVDALSPHHFYNVPTCKDHIASPAGTDCMTRGCAVRRACPISQRFDRPQAQSSHHMRAFLGES